MGLPPAERQGARVVRYAILDERCKPTGNCLHRVGGRVAGPAAYLAICQCKGEGSYYLVYCDSAWQVVTDTWHETLEDAERQAELEYDGVSRCWQSVPNTK